MKVVILCGGKGTRMGDATKEMPKPLAKIGDKPVLWHIMKIFSSHGFNDFILCLGFKGEMIKEYFEKNKEDWNIEFADTGLESTKSERLNQVKDLIDGENFFLAYGDDVSDVDISRLLKFHEYMGMTVTITGVKLKSQFGVVEMDEENVITEFKEKPILEHWMNGGFMVINKEIFKHLHEGELENEVFAKLAELKKICAYKHKGAWKAMSTLKDNNELNEMWRAGKAFWNTWE
ncbi:MAG: NTP transferase domain-containing protein [Candidatus Aenigmarchaeota archaeon]|nr:NTP transferase domain-containing protein [Candidatus Aenigmarchaeota archaeon]